MPLLKDIKPGTLRDAVIAARKALLKQTEKSPGKPAKFCLTGDGNGTMAIIYSKPTEVSLLEPAQALELAQAIIRNVIEARPELAIKRLKDQVESMLARKH